MSTTEGNTPLEDQWCGKCDGKCHVEIKVKRQNGKKLIH